MGTVGGPRRVAIAAALMAVVLVALLGAWFATGWHDVRARQAAIEDAPVVAAAARAGQLARELRGELDQLVEREATRPYFHYQNLFHDPRSPGESVTPSPLASGPEDPLILGYFQIDANAQVTTPSINDQFPQLSEAKHLVEHRAFRDAVAMQLAQQLAPPRGTLIAQADPKPQQPPPHPVTRTITPTPPGAGSAEVATQAIESPNTNTTQTYQLDPNAYTQNSNANAVYSHQTNDVGNAYVGNNIGNDFGNQPGGKSTTNIGGNQTGSTNQSGVPTTGGNQTGAHQNATNTGGNPTGNQTGAHQNATNSGGNPTGANTGGNPTDTTNIGGNQTGAHQNTTNVGGNPASAGNQTGATQTGAHQNTTGTSGNQTTANSAGNQTGATQAGAHQNTTNIGGNSTGANSAGNPTGTTQTGAHQNTTNIGGNPTGANSGGNQTGTTTTGARQNTTNIGGNQTGANSAGNQTGTTTTAAHQNTTNTGGNQTGANSAGNQTGTSGATRTGAHQNTANPTGAKSAGNQTGTTTTGATQTGAHQNTTNTGGNQTGANSAGNQTGQTQSGAHQNTTNTSGNQTTANNAGSQTGATTTGAHQNTTNTGGNQTGANSAGNQAGTTAGAHENTTNIGGNPTGANSAGNRTGSGATRTGAHENATNTGGNQTGANSAGNPTGTTAGGTSAGRQTASTDHQTINPSTAQPRPVTITVSPLEWHTLPFSGGSSLVALREVQTPDGNLAQGFVVDRAAMTSWLADHAGDLVAELHPRVDAASQSVELVPGWELTVQPNPREMASSVAEAASVATAFIVRFLIVGAIAVLAAMLVVWLVARAERYARERSQFAAAAAHELRTPLAGLQLYGDMLSDGLGDPAKLRDYARRMSEEASRLGRVVSNVLGFSQLERGNLSIDPKLGNVAAALRDLVEHVQPTFDRAGAAIDLDVPESLDVRFDRDALARIVGNLLDNAEKYTREADDRTIHLTARRTGEWIEIAVRDHGAGVAAPTKLFQAFARGVSTDGPAGLGLGLALSRSLASAMGGELAYREGEGATFVLRIPVA